MGDARIASELGSTLRKIGGLTEDAAAVDPHWARVSSTLVSLARTASLPESAKGSATEVTAVISRITLVLSNVTSQATSAVSERVHSLVLESAREAAAALLEASTSATAASEEHSKKVASLNTLLAGLVRAFSSALSQDAEVRFPFPGFVACLTFLFFVLCNS